MTGTLTMRGVAKTLTLPVAFLGSAKDPWGNERANFSTAITLNRKDYGINGSIPLVRISDRVEVTVDLKGKRVSGPPLTLKK